MIKVQIMSKRKCMPQVQIMSKRKCMPQVQIMSKRKCMPQVQIMSKRKCMPLKVPYFRPYDRPHTRGDLVRSLKAGIKCEVVASNEETTRMLIDGWLSPPPYIVRTSENEGWVVFEKAKK